MNKSIAHMARKVPCSVVDKESKKTTNPSNSVSITSPEVNSLL